MRGCNVVAPRRIIDVMFASVTLLLLLARQEPGVTYTTVAKPLRKVLQELSPQLGRTYTVAPDLAEEPMVLALNSVPRKEVLQKLADAVMGKWSDSMVLSLDRKKLEASTERELRERTQIFQKILDDHLEKVKAASYSPAKLDDRLLEARRKPAPFAVDSFVPRWDTYHEPPMQRLTWRLLNRLGARTIAACVSRRPECFISRPQPGERGFPEDVSDLVELYAQEEQDWYQALSRTGFLKKDFKIPPLADPATLNVSVRIEGDETFLAKAMLNVVGPEGIRDFTFKLLGDQIYKDSIWPALQKRSKDRSLQLSAETLELNENNGPYGDHPGIAASTSAKLWSPMKLDPLSFSISEELIAIAKEEHRNLIGVPDDLLSYGDIVNGRENSASKFLDASIRSRVLNVQRTDNWLVVTPGEAGLSYGKRADRKVLQDFLAVAKADRLSIEQLSDLATRYRDTKFWSVLEYAARLLKLQVDDESLYRWYGGLSPEQVAAMQRPSGLPYRSLSADQKVDLVACFNTALSQWEVKGVDVNGIPPDAVLHATESSGIVGCFWQEGYCHTYRYSDLKDPYPEPPKLLSPAMERRIGVELRGTDFHDRCTLREVHGANSKPIPIEQFPSSFREIGD